MGLFNHFPYTNYHELNLNWLLNTVKGLSTSVEEIKSRLDVLEANSTTHDVIFSTNEAGDIVCNKTYQQIDDLGGNYDVKALYNGVSITGYELRTEGTEPNITDRYMAFDFPVMIRSWGADGHRMHIVEVRVHEDDTVDWTPINIEL